MTLFTLTLLDSNYLFHRRFKINLIIIVKYKNQYYKTIKVSQQQTRTLIFYYAYYIFLYCKSVFLDFQTKLRFILSITGLLEKYFIGVRGHIWLLGPPSFTGGKQWVTNLKKRRKSLHNSFRRECSVTPSGKDLVAYSWPLCRQVGITHKNVKTKDFCLFI